MSKSNETMMWKGVAAMVLTLVATQDAFALGSRRLPDIRDEEPVPVPVVVVDPAPEPEPAAEEPAPAPTPVVDEDLSLEDSREGYRLGRRNGQILVDRLKLATLGQDHDCSAVGALERALIKVVRKVSAPEGGSEALVLGFYRGYIDAIRDAIRATRHACDALAYDDGGAFAGGLYGGLLCSVTSVSLAAGQGASLDLATRLELSSLYEGWSGGKSDVLEGCRSTIELTVRECTGLDDVSALELVLQRSCAE